MATICGIGILLFAHGFVSSGSLQKRPHGVLPTFSEMVSLGLSTPEIVQPKGIILDFVVCLDQSEMPQATELVTNFLRETSPQSN